jgi:long-chain acyl-CoA synthetase
MNGRNIHDIFQMMVRSHPDKILIYQPMDTGYLRFTYRQVAEASRALAWHLASVGGTENTRVTLISESRYEWVVSYLAVVSLGWTVCPLDPQLSPREWTRFTTFIEPEIIILSENFFSLAPRLQQATPFFKGGIYFGPKQEALHGWSSFTEETRPKTVGPAPRAPNDIASIVFTSGTYGTPLAVELSHENLIRAGEALAEDSQGNPSEFTLSIAPLHHVYGFTGLMGVMCGQSGIVLFPKLQRETVLRALKELRPQYLMGVPAFFERVGKALQNQLESQAPGWIRRRLKAEIEQNKAKPDKFLFFRKLLFRKIHRAIGGRICYMASGGAPLEPRLNRLFDALGLPLFEGYGLSETTAMITRNYPKNKKIGSVGKVLPGSQVKIDRPDAEGIGEICVKGPPLFKGYFRNPEATRAAFDEEGWFHTGDLGRLDEEGFLFFIGRKKDVIVTPNGKNIYPEELEHFFSALPLAVELCVFGVPRKVGGKSEQVHLQIVPDLEAAHARGIQDIQQVLKESVAELSQQLPEYQRPTSLGFSREPFPKTTTLKIKKFQVKTDYLRELEEMEKAKRPLQTVTLDNEEASFVVEQIKKILPEDRPVSLNSHFTLDLGLDSLALVELWANLEESFQVSIPRDEIVQWHCVQDVFNYVQSHPDVFSVTLHRSPPTNPDKENSRRA